MCCSPDDGAENNHLHPAEDPTRIERHENQIFVCVCPAAMMWTVGMASPMDTNCSGHETGLMFPPNKESWEIPLFPETQSMNMKSVNLIFLGYRIRVLSSTLGFR